MTKEIYSQESEVILITLDQMGQTIEVMTAVVRRLRKQLLKNDTENENTARLSASKKSPVRRRLLRPQRRILH